MYRRSLCRIDLPPTSEVHKKRKRDGGSSCRGFHGNSGTGTSPQPAGQFPSSEEDTPPRQREDPCFEIRPTPDDKAGVGTFATRTIQCGEVLVSEEPAISAPAPGSQHSGLTCARCLAPLGDLRWHVLSYSGRPQVRQSEEGKDPDNGSEEYIPGLGADSGPEFTSARPADLPFCRCGDVWCSAACLDADATFGHRLLCTESSDTNKDKKDYHCDASRRRFRDFAEANGAEFLLAGKVMAAALGVVMQDFRRQRRMATPGDDTAIDESALDDEAILWWRQYNCPPWWDIGAAKDDAGERERRRELCRKGHALLSDAFRAPISKGEIVPPPILDRLCTEHNLAEVLGMLHCNVMEIEYASPAQNYFDHLMHAVEEAEEEDGSDSKGAANSLKSWVLECFPRPRSNKSGDDGVGSSSLDLSEHVASATAADSLLPAVPPVMGSGLFPILSLANHHCDPNASIEFLGESREGSLVALRDISAGEEICVTYVPNGDLDCGDETGERFRNFKPTRTWAYLNQEGDESSEVEGEEADSDDGSGCKSPETEDTGHEVDAGQCESDSSVREHDAALNDNLNTDHDCCDENDQDVQGILNEGAYWADRCKSLSEYGFICRCDRCEHERNHSEGQYDRKAHHSACLHVA